MNFLLFSIFFFLVVVIAVELLKPTRQKGRNRKEPGLDEPTRPTRKQFQIPHIARALMTPSEKDFFRTLSEVGADQGFLVAPQVAMSAMVDIPKKYNENRYVHTNRAGFAQKRLDFVLLDADSLDPILVIELDDPSHDGREEEDAQREELLEATGYRLLRVDVRERLSPEGLADRIAEACGE